jgi:hypothetical protein
VTTIDILTLSTSRVERYAISSICACLNHRVYVDFLIFYRCCRWPSQRTSYFLTKTAEVRLNCEPEETVLKGCLPVLPDETKCFTPEAEVIFVLFHDIAGRNCLLQFTGLQVWALNRTRFIFRLAVKTKTFLISPSMWKRTLRSRHACECSVTSKRYRANRNTTVKHVRVNRKQRKGKTPSLLWLI